MENTGTTPTPATPDGGTKPEALTAETLETLLNKRDETLVNQILGKLEHQKSLESMDEDERKAAENEDKIKTLEAENAKYKIEAKKGEIAKVLANRGLDANLVDIVVTSDNDEEIIKKINVIENIIKNSVDEQVKKRIAGSKPGAPSVDTSGMTKEEFAALSIAEQQQIFNENPSLYEKLI